MKNKTAGFIIAWSVVLCLISLVFLVVVGMIGDARNPPICIAHAKVVSIDAIYTRGGEISLSNGQYHVKASDVKVGDDFCIRWKMWKLNDIFSK